MTNLVIVTKSPEVFHAVCKAGVLFRRRVMLIDVGLSNFPILPSETELFVYFLNTDSSPVLAAIKALSISKNESFFLLDDATHHLALYLPYLDQATLSIPRLASSHLTFDGPPGTKQVDFNPLYGTIYPAHALNTLGVFDSDLEDSSMAAYKWAGKCRSKGYTHIQVWSSRDDSFNPTLTQNQLISYPSISRGEDPYLAPFPKSTHPWLGTQHKLPWNYPITVVIPHYGGNYRLLRNAINLWRAQRIKPYIIVYDTGTPSSHHPELLAFEDVDVEIHFNRWHAYKEIWSGVASAYQHAIIDSRTSHILFTHNDILPMTRDVTEDLLRLCDAKRPVVGYGKLNTKQIGTTLTMIHTPTIHNSRISWVNLNGTPNQIHTYDDFTRPESTFNENLNQCGIEPTIIGYESNTVRDITSHYHHIGGYTFYDLYHSDRMNKIQPVAEEFLHEAELRLVSWRED